MADKTKIQWTDATWNPVRGCSRVSEGCRNCYAERNAMRMAGPGGAYEGLVQIVNGHSRWTGTVALAGSSLTRPLDWNRPRRIFVNSMSDLFHENLPDEAIDRVFAVMADCPRHAFQVLTKRAQRMEEYINNLAGYDVLRSQRIGTSAVDRWPLPNVWLGVSVEDQTAANDRIPLLLQTPAAVRWVSAEPLLGPVNLTRYLRHRHWRNCLDDAGPAHGVNEICGVPEVPNGVNWVVVGGESGPGARSMNPQWARTLRDQCQAAGVAFFFKQWGEFLPDTQNPEVIRGTGPMPPDYSGAIRVGKRIAGRELDGRTWDEFPEVSACGR